jgi:hypothetical protein
MRVARSIREDNALHAVLVVAAANARLAGEAAASLKQAGVAGCVQ